MKVPFWASKLSCCDWHQMRCNILQSDEHCLRQLRCCRHCITTLQRDVRAPTGRVNIAPWSMGRRTKCTQRFCRHNLIQTLQALHTAQAWYPQRDPSNVAIINQTLLHTALSYNNTKFWLETSANELPQAQLLQILPVSLHSGISHASFSWQWTSVIIAHPALSTSYSTPEG